MISKVATVVGCSSAGGFGNAIVQVLQHRGYDAIAVRRGELDVDAIRPGLVVLTLFDHTAGGAGLQEQLFHRVFARFRQDPDSQLVSVGSTAYRFQYPTDAGLQQYAQAKRSLHDSFYRLCLDTQSYRCRALLFEPGSMETIRGRPTPPPCLGYDDAARLLVDAVAINPKFLHVAARG